MQYRPHLTVAVSASFSVDTEKMASSMNSVSSVEKWLEELKAARKTALVQDGTSKNMAVLGFQEKNFSHSVHSDVRYVAGCHYICITQTTRHTHSLHM